MNFSEEWKLLWPTSNTYMAPPLLPRADVSSTVGPLLFHPLPTTITPLLSSQSVSPPTLPPPPNLSFPRFIETTSSALPTTSTSIPTEFSPAESPVSSFSGNRLESIPCPDGRSTLAFFPTGDNLDRVGFVLLSVRDSQLCVDGDVFLSSNSFGHKILQLAAREAVDTDGDECLGFLVASTMHSVHWFRVMLSACGKNLKKPVLVSIHSRLFKSSSVVHVCWSPHLPNESLVLLESGNLLLFDEDDSSLTISFDRYKGKRLPVSWDGHDKWAKGGWFSCQFTWSPRIVVVANSDAVFLVDFRSSKCSVRCLMKVELLGVTDVVETDRFSAFSKAGSGGFYYVVASQCWLVLLDIRVPCKPVLQWLHNHHYPHYLSVHPLSALRGNLGIDEFNRASENGNAVILGSFWTGEFSLFCYGPSLASLKQHVSFNKPIRVSNPFYAWDLPSDLSLSGLDCPCSSCLLKEDLAKDDLPEWIDWQQKKQLALGFFILHKDVSSLMFEGDDDAGFVLIRLMSSGNLESQRYRACSDFPNKVETAHVESPFDAKDFHLCSMDDDDEYKFPRMFKYVGLEYLYAYMNGSLTKNLFSKFKRLSVDVDRTKRSAAPSHESMPKKLKMCGLTGSTSSFSVFDAIMDTSMPSSVYEVACRRMWDRLPIGILEMAFSSYEECFGVLVDSKKAYLDFPAVPNQTQLPPFNLRKPSDRSNRWSKRVQPGNDFVGPVIPLSVSLTLKEICENGRSNVEKVNQFSPDTEVARESQQVLRASREMCVSPSNIDVAGDYSVSLVNDSEETWDASREKNVFSYKPAAFSYALPEDQKVLGLHDCTTMISKLSDNKQGIHKVTDGSKFFDDLCPVDLKFDDSSELIVGPKELQSYSILKEQFKKWQHNYKPYSDFGSQFKS